MFLLVASFTDGKPAQVLVVYSPAHTPVLLRDSSIPTIGLRYQYIQQTEAGASHLYQFAYPQVGMGPTDVSCNRIFPEPISGENVPVLKWFNSNSHNSLAHFRQKLRFLCPDPGLHYRTNYADTHLRRSRMLRHRYTLVQDHKGGVTVVNHDSNSTTLVYLNKDVVPRVSISVSKNGNHTNGKNQSTQSNTVYKQFVIYQRNSNRKFHKLEETLEILMDVWAKHLWEAAGTDHEKQHKQRRVQWEVFVLHHDDSMDPCELQYLMFHTDVLLTPHGFQEVSLIFMRPGSRMIEVFPYRYLKYTYQNLARSLGIVSSYLENTVPTSISNEILRLVPSASYCMQFLRCRGYARSDNVMLYDEDLTMVAGILLKEQGF